MIDNLKPRVLVGIASRDGAEFALEFAIAEARRRGVGIHLVHALHPALMAGDARSWAVVEGSIREVGAHLLASAARLVAQRMGPDFPVSTELVHGTATSALVAEGARSAVVVLERPAPDDRSRTRALSVTNGVASRAHAAVVAVPRGWVADDSAAPVCVAVKRPEHASAVVRAAITEAASRHVPVRIVHAWTIGDTLDAEAFTDEAAHTYSDQLEQRFGDALASALAGSDVEMELVMRRGRAADVLIDESSRCALLVMGRHESSVSQLPHLGSLVRSALRDAQCPVMVVDTLPAHTGGSLSDSNDRRPLVVGVNGSTGSDSAVRKAAREAHSIDVPLRLVHVVPNFLPTSPTVSRADLTRAGEALLRRAVASARSAAPELVHIETRLPHGPRMRALFEAGAGSQLLMVGRDRHPVERFLSGRTAAALAERAPCPVEVVSPFWEVAPRYDVVIAGLAATSDAVSLLAHAVPLAAARQSSLVVLHAGRAPSGYDGIIQAHLVRTEIEERISKEVAPLLAHWRAACPEVDVTLRVVHDHVVRALAHATEHADVLVLLRRPHIVPGPVHFGTTRALLSASSCTVRIVPEGKEPRHPVLFLSHDTEIPGEVSRPTTR